MMKIRRWILYWGPVVLLCSAIFINSCYAFPGALPDIPFLDKVLHFVVYGILGALSFRAMRPRELSEGQLLRFWSAISFTILFGLSDEVHQSFVPARTADLFDLLADACGGWAGALLYQRLIRNYYQSFPYHSYIDKLKNIL